MLAWFSHNWVKRAVGDNVVGADALRTHRHADQGAEKSSQPMLVVNLPWSLYLRWVFNSGQHESPCAVQIPVMTLRRPSDTLWLVRHTFSFGK